MLFQIKILKYWVILWFALKKQINCPVLLVPSLQCSVHFMHAGCGSSLPSRPFICLFLFLVKLFPNQWPWLKCKMTKEFSTREWIPNQRDFLSCQPNILCSKYSWCWTGRISVAVCAKWNSIISVLYEDEPGEGDPGQQRYEAAAQLVAQHQKLPIQQVTDEPRKRLSLFLGSSVRRLVAYLSYERSSCRWPWFLFSLKSLFYRRKRPNAFRVI